LETPCPASAAASATAFVTLALGRSANAIDLSVPPALPVHAPGNLKARSFDFLADPLAPHSALCSFAELFAAFAGHVPTSAYNATLEAENVCCTITLTIWLLWVSLTI
jgi:hypothetical protein